MERNQKTLGQVALTDLERRKDYDGNLFFAFFTDKDTGDTDVRTIDATEMQEIVTDPNDADTELLFKRQWFEKTFVTQSGLFATAGKAAWYPSLNHWQAVQDGTATKEQDINGQEIMWDVPVYHRKCGTVGKWLFGCPRIYPMLDWAKASRKFLEHCMAVKAALAQIAMTITTKGGQQALEGIKQQLGSTVATGNSSWYEQNPAAVAGSIWASGPEQHWPPSNRRARAVIRKKSASTSSCAAWSRMCRRRFSRMCAPAILRRLRLSTGPRNWHS